ncbi:MAG: SPFH domain-containing protein [Neomegalonema sp.]|nr:SPFH domain-containing protein [Neomegalonema sp.]
MSLFDTLFGQFIDVIAWTDDTSDTLVWRFERQGHEIKHSAKLTVREGQAAVFVHEGKLADIFPPGLYRLKTANLPILSSLQHWDHGFESPFKSEVYYVSTRQFTDLKWGTKNPLMIRDPEFGPTRLRAYGTYAMRVIEPGVFLREIVGTDGEFTTDEIAGQLRNIIVTRFSNALATAKIPVLDLAANLDDLGNFLRERINPEMATYGVEISKLLVENISLPDEVEKALDRRTSMGVVGDLRRYAQYQAAEAIREGASAGGAIGTGLGMGAGMSMGRDLAGVFAPGQSAAPAASGPSHMNPSHMSPPPLPGAQAEWHVALDGVASGPHSLVALAEMAQGGQLTGSTLVWKNGMAAWAPAGSQAALEALFDQKPPALPGA